MSNSVDGLSIGQLSARTGVGVSTLRMWEQRHGFPVPDRRSSGHRRYDEAAVEAVGRVVAARDAGLRLDVAIRDALAVREDSPPAASVFATLRRQHPEVSVHRMRKPTLLALSWAIEDQFAARADRAHLFGLFQDQDYYRPAAARWTELARCAASAFAFSAHAEEPPPAPGPVQVPLAEDSPLRREWAVVVDSKELPVVLTAWEVPGQVDVPERERVFESAWTVDPRAVRTAARVCVDAAAQSHTTEAAPVQFALADEPGPTVVDPAAASALFSRVVAYVDAFPGRPR